MAKVAEVNKAVAKVAARRTSSLPSRAQQQLAKAPPARVVAPVKLLAVNPVSKEKRWN